MVAILVVHLNNTQKIGKIGFGNTSISIVITPYFIITEIYVATDDIICSITRNRIHYQIFVWVSRLHCLNK